MFVPKTQNLIWANGEYTSVTKYSGCKVAKTNYNENENENVQKIIAIIKSEESCSLILMAFTMAIILEKVSFSSR